MPPAPSSIVRRRGHTPTTCTWSSSGGREERRTLAFRDYLREHADIARTYERLKRTLAIQFAGPDAESREAYARAKGDFIERVVSTAIGEGYPRGAVRTGPVG
jgi:GrpB-like predicted nucleotidyltransferase (UPF0157 family)